MTQQEKLDAAYVREMTKLRDYFDAEEEKARVVNYIVGFAIAIPVSIGLFLLSCAMCS